MTRGFNLTKNDMARVVVQALYNMKSLPAADDRRVVKMERSSKKWLTERHALALICIQQEIEKREAA